MTDSIMEKAMEAGKEFTLSGGVEKKVKAANTKKKFKKIAIASIAIIAVGFIGYYVYNYVLYPDPWYMKIF